MDRSGRSAYIALLAQSDMGNCGRTGDGSSNETRATTLGSGESPVQYKSKPTCSGTQSVCRLEKLVENSKRGLTIF
jgi:hypothetical protein